MTDETNPFAEGDLDPVGSTYVPAMAASDDEDKDNPFAEGSLKVAGSSGGVTQAGAFGANFARGIVPAGGAIAGATYGAEAGALAGGPVGAFIGGVGGAWLASYLGGKAQDYVASEVPDSWKDALGQSDRQLQLDNQQYPISSFIGGLAPYAVTLSPFGAAKNLPAEATALERILAHPATARVFGGAVMGGLEFGQEYLTDGELDWRKGAIATAFGAVLNNPNALGRAIDRKLAAPFRPPTAPPARATPNSDPVGAEEYDLARGGTNQEEAFPGLYEAINQHVLPSPTLAELDSENMLGFGATRETFYDPELRSTETRDLATQRRAEEIKVTGNTPMPDIEVAARRLDPDAFTQYDELTRQQDALRRQINEVTDPTLSYIRLQELDQQRIDLTEQLKQHIEDNNGYAGTKLARQLKAQIRASQVEYTELASRRAALEAGEAVDTPQIAAVRQKLLTTTQELERLDVYPRIRAARERAAEQTGQPLEPPAPEAVVPPSVLPQEPVVSAPSTPPVPGEPTPAPPKPPLVDAITQQLVSAGIPPEQAKLNAILRTHIATARANWFEGKRGTPEQLYNENPPVYKRAEEPPPAPRQQAPLRSRADILGEASKIQEELARTKSIKDTVEFLDPLTRASLLAPHEKAPQKPDYPRPLTTQEAFESRTGGKAGKKINPASANAVDLAQMLGIPTKHVQKGDRMIEVPVDKGPFKTGAKDTVEDMFMGLAHDGHLGPEFAQDAQNATFNDFVDAFERNNPVEHSQDWEDYDAYQEHWDNLRKNEAAVQKWITENKPELYTPREGPRLKLIAARMLEHTPVENFDLKIKNAIDAAQLLMKREQAGTDRAEQIFAPKTETAGPHEEAPLPEENEYNPSEYSDELYQAVRRKAEQLYKGKFQMKDGQPVHTYSEAKDASTFIHETGHEILERMLEDAEHELAPDRLKQDAAIVRRELGIKAGERPTVRQHEQFAKWFEQYMREGIAPSKGLKGVFEQIGAMLKGIYRDIRALGLPISDDMRGVFDRQVSAEAQSIAVSRHAANGPTIHDIHRIDFETTPPHEAGPVADRNATETVRAERELPLEVIHEAENSFAKAAEALKPTSGHGGETGGGAGGPSEVVGGGERPSGVLTDWGGGGESGDVVESHSGPIPEEPPVGARESAQAKPNGAGRGNGRSRPSQTTGPDRFAPQRPDPPLSSSGPSVKPERIANIRIDNLKSLPEIIHEINESAKATSDFGGPHTVTDQQIADLARSIGVTPDKINQQWLASWMGGWDDLGAKFKATADMATAMAFDVHEKSVALDPRDPESVANLIEAQGRLDLLLTAVSKANYNWGRAGNVLRDIQKSFAKLGSMEELAQAVKDQTGQTLYQLVEKARLSASLDTPEKVASFLAKAKERSVGKGILESFVNGLISGIATHATYLMALVGSTLQTVGEIPVAAAFGKFANARGRVEVTPEVPGGLGLEGTEGPKVNPRVYAGEAVAQLKAAKQGLLAGSQAAIEGLRTGQTTLLPNETSHAYLPYMGETSLKTARRITTAPVSWDEVKADAFSLLQGAKDAIHASNALAKAGGVEGAPAWGWGMSPSGQIPNFQIRGVTRLPVGDAIRLPSRAVAGMHSFIRVGKYTMGINGMAYRAAVEAGIPEGLARDSFMADFRNNPPQWAVDEATKEATSVALMDQGGEFMKTIRRLVNTEFKLPGLGPTPVLKFIDPFVTIAGNIINQSLVQRSPLGWFDGRVRADLLGKNGNVAQDMAAAKMIVGSLLGLTFGGLAAAGYASGSGPTDPNKNAMWRLAGNQAHSVRIGDMWYDVHRLGPMGMLLGVSADMYDVAHHTVRGDLQEAANAAVMGIYHNIIDESFMRGPSDLLKAIEEHQRYGDAWIAKFAGSFVPYSTEVRQLDRAIDPYTRRARTIMDGIKQGIPGLSETLYPRRDIWGRPMPNGSALIGSGITAIYEREMSHDPVNIAMLNLGMGPAPVDRRILNVPLTDEQYDQFATIAGVMSKQRLDVIVNSPDFATWPNDIKMKVIESTIRQSRQSAEDIIKMKFPDILTQARDAKASKYRALR